MAGRLKYAGIANLKNSAERISWSPFVSIIVVTLFAAFAVKMHWFVAFDRLLYDFLIRHHTTGYPDDIVLIAIDEPSLGKLGAWPWDRRRHAELLETLHLADLVVFDIIFSEPQSASLASGTPPDSLTPAGSNSPDTAFAKAIATHGDVILPMYIEQQYMDYAREVLPIPLLTTSAAGIGQVNVDFEVDGIVRGIAGAAGLGTPYWPHLTIAMLQHQGMLPEGGKPELEKHKGSTFGLEKSGLRYIRFVGPARSVYRFSYADILEGIVSPEAFKNKTVFVGATAKGLGDNIPTPFGLLSGVEFHANAYHAIKTGGIIRTLDEGWHFVIVVMLTFLASWSLSHISPTAFLFSSFIAIAGIALSVAAIFGVYSVWVPPAPLLAAIAVFYPLWSWRRIQIALNYLKAELISLKLVAGNQNYQAEEIVAEIRDCLDQLVEAALLVDASVSPLTGSGEAGLKNTWPDASIEGRAVCTAVVIGETTSLIKLQSPVSGSHAYKILKSLLESLAPEKNLSGNSYELVEKTIDEISRAKKEANRIQMQMNQSMMRLQDAVIVVDIAGRIIFFNESFANIFGGELKPGYPVSCLQDIFGRLMWNSVLRRVMLEEKTVYQEFESVQDKTLLCQAAPIRIDDAHVSIYVFVFTDVTQLRDLERSKNEALAFLSHDMRSPIVSQLALIEQSQKPGQQNIPDQKLLLNKLAGFAERSLKYAEDFLLLAKAENLEEENFQLVDMHGVIDAAYSNVVSQASLAGITIETERPADDCWVLGDNQLLERAITNLLLNAIQHSGNSRLVSLGLRKEGDVVVVISDRGTGIDKKLLPQLFEPYFRARNRQDNQAKSDATTNPRPDSQNYGLGLSFVHSVVMRHGGRIEVESEPGDGTKFELFFPRGEVD